MDYHRRIEASQPTEVEKISTDVADETPNGVTGATTMMIYATPVGLLAVSPAVYPVSSCLA